MGDDEALAELADEAVTELDHLGKVVPGIDVEQRKRQAGAARAGNPESFPGEPQHDAGILAA